MGDAADISASNIRRGAGNRRRGMSATARTAVSENRTASRLPARPSTRRSASWSPKMTPTAVELALEIRREIEAQYEEADRLRSRATERAQIEADLAQRRYMLVNLVADTLEGEWNDKLRALVKVQEKHSGLARRTNSSSTRRQGRNPDGTESNSAAGQSPAQSDRARRHAPRQLHLSRDRRHPERARNPARRISASGDGPTLGSPRCASLISPTKRAPLPL
jgi:hypothetical protein